MYKDINHWCVICGTGYHACDSCEATGITTWKRITDTSNHYKIYLIINDYTYNIISKQQAYEMLKKCDLAGWENFLPSVAIKINDILSLEIKAEQTRKKKVKDNI